MIHPPQNFDWPTWIARWDRMQARYLVKRDERFETIARLVATTQGTSPRILDLGCGTASLMVTILDAIPEASAVGADLDPTLLWLAEKRLADYGSRAKVVQLDLRDEKWPENFGQPFNAIISATALHWLSPTELSALYQQLVALLRPGGIFLNADHAASTNPAMQSAWEEHREQMRTDEQMDIVTDDWNGFWEAYLATLGPEAKAEREQALGDFQGNDDGLPLAWHFDHLRQAGFSAVDCFWRCDCDAIYGGIH